MSDIRWAFNGTAILMCRQSSDAGREFQFLATGKEIGRGRKSGQLKKLLVQIVFERKGEASDAEIGPASTEVGTVCDRIECREVPRSESPLNVVWCAGNLRTDLYAQPGRVGVANEPGSLESISSRLVRKGTVVQSW